MPITTTFRKCHQASACKLSYRKMATAMGGVTQYGQDSLILVLKVLEILDLDDAIWVLARTCGKNGRDMSRLWTTDCAAHVLHIFEQACPDDDRPRKAIEAARAYVHGEISAEAQAAARDAATNAAWDAVKDTAWNAAWAATDGLSEGITEDIAGDSARGAVGGTTGDTAWDIERAWQIERLKLYLTSKTLPSEWPLPERLAT